MVVEDGPAEIICFPFFREKVDISAWAAHTTWKGDLLLLHAKTCTHLTLQVALEAEDGCEGHGTQLLLFSISTPGERVVQKGGPAGFGSTLTSLTLPPACSHTSNPGSTKTSSCKEQREGPAKPFSQVMRCMVLRRWDIKRHMWHDTELPETSPGKINLILNCNNNNNKREFPRKKF